MKVSHFKKLGSIILYFFSVPCLVHSIRPGVEKEEKKKFKSFIRIIKLGSLGGSAV